MWQLSTIYVIKYVQWITEKVKYIEKSEANE